MPLVTRPAVPPTISTDSMASTASPTAPPTVSPTASSSTDSIISTASSTASTARLTVPLLARPAARPASRARRTGSSAPMHRWELAIVVAAVVLGVAILLDVVASLADFGGNLPPMSILTGRKYDYDALLDKDLKYAAEKVAAYLGAPPEPFEATKIRRWQALTDVTLTRVNSDYLTLWSVYDTDNQTVIDYYEKLQRFRTQEMPIFDRELRRLAGKLSAYISVSNYDIEEAVMYMTEVLSMDTDEINMRWGAQPPSGLVNHAHRLIFGPPDTGVDPLIIRDFNLWDTLCICRARLIELNQSLVRMCENVEEVYDHITPPFNSVSDFMYHEVQVRRKIAEKDMKNAEESYINAMQASENRSSNHWRHSSNLFVHAFGRMLGGQSSLGQIEQYEALEETLSDLRKIQMDLLVARSHIQSLKDLATQSSIQIASVDEIAQRDNGQICDSLEMDILKESRRSPRELLAVLQQHVTAFVEGVRRWDADDFYNQVKLMQKEIENREVEEIQEESESL